MLDCIVIGGGPSGIMAAIAAATNGAKVLLIEKGNKLGRKLLISGGGRCNVTNHLPVNELIRHIPGNGRFLYSAFSIFNQNDIIDFFEEMGIPLKEEDHGRMFPVNDQAQTVVDALVHQLQELDVTILMNTPVEEVLFEQRKVRGVRLKNGKTIDAKTVIVAVGGKSVPQTGSTGDGYAWAKRAGHTVTPLYPTEVPLISKEPFILQKKLQGLALRDISLSVLNDKEKAIITHRWDVLFTHFGISGPAALRSSQFVVKQLQKADGGKVKLKIDLFPDKSEEQVYQEMFQLLASEPKKTLKNVLKKYIPERFLTLLLEQLKLNENTTFANLYKKNLLRLANKIKGFTFFVSGTLPLERAFVTGGGVSVKEIEPKTMASKLAERLYFSGEILDIHGYTGGFNITAAFSTGYVAGLSAAQKAKTIL